DILQITERRNRGMDIIILPAVVQGAEAASSIAARIREVNEFLLADVMIVGRGGGSVEDLLPFSEDCVIRAIHESEIPVISAVGHEIDWAISDFVADLRAPTPSAAAELVCESSMDQIEKVNTLRTAMIDAISAKVAEIKLRLAAFSAANARAQLENRLNSVRMKLDNVQTAIQHSTESLIAQRKARAELLKHKLMALSPLAVLERGYSIVTDESGKTVKSIKDVAMGQGLDIRVADGRIRADVREVENGRQ
ncbi:MAG: exodeoxyribonuclease VII large subunit, partial [Spirochaetales bacterium]|nr:exodeoxyribonuclease VII large subunit [Spirochaetales bacterium]